MYNVMYVEHNTISVHEEGTLLSLRTPEAIERERERERAPALHTRSTPLFLAGGSLVSALEGDRAGSGIENSAE